MRKITLLLFFSFSFVAISQDFSGKNLINNMRSDTIDVLNYDLKLDFRQMGLQQLIGEATILFEAKMNDVAGISLDLKDFTVDSVKQNAQHLVYSHSDELLRVTLDTPIHTNDQSSVTIYYRGSPAQDPSGFGGFYFMGGFAFNLGVGLTDQPHNYGRVWHPCFDNFVERATYDIELLSPAGTRGYAVGELLSFSTNADGDVISTWRMNETIPTYLAAITVGNYTHVNDTYTSPITGEEIPIMLTARPSDTTNMKNSFINLKAAMEIYETAFGPYKWNKIGYALIPFNSGAMEHATMISYPALIANGTLNWENIMVHEVAHSWWGNNVTCRTASDMWINEGFASYSEPLFQEFHYGHENYMQRIRTTHRKVLQQAHFDDDGFHPLSGVPSSATYGTHSYSKGETAVHNLRKHMGDEAFFTGLQYIQQVYDEQDIDAAEFRDALATSSGINLDDFFEAYIFNPGFAGFSIDSVHYELLPNDEYEVTAFIRQKLFEAPSFHNGIQLEITCVDNNRMEYSSVVQVNGEYTEVTWHSPVAPHLVYLNKNDDVLHAVTAENITIGSAATTVNNYAYFRQTTTAIGDSVLLRVEHHRVQPDPFTTSEMNHMYILSTERFWTIDGIWDEHFEFDGHFTFDARNINTGNLDNQLLTNHVINGQPLVFHEDSIVLVWRPDVSTEWSVFTNYTLNFQGSPTDGFGRIDAIGLSKGHYTFALKKSSLSLTEQEQSPIRVFPNPASHQVTIASEQTMSRIRIWNAEGREVRAINVDGLQIEIPIAELPAGIYTFEITLSNHSSIRTQLIKHE